MGHCIVLQQSVQGHEKTAMPPLNVPALRIRRPFSFGVKFGRK
jgi:hypothetical protein